MSATPAIKTAPAVKRGLQLIPDGIIRGPAFSPNCADCPLSDPSTGKPRKPVPGEGPKNPRFLIIAEGPGQQETLKGRPLIGRSGQLLMDVLAGIGVQREEVWLGNATLCEPINKAHVEKARICCEPRLHDELSMFPGVPVAALGTYAMRAFVDRDAQRGFTITEMAGALHDVDVAGERSVITTIHPAAILRGGGGSAKKDRSQELKIWHLIYDVRKVLALADGKNIRFSDDIETIYEVDPKRADYLLERFYEEALQHRLISCDLETTAKPMIMDEITAIGLAHVDLGISLIYEAFSTKGWRTFRQLMGDARIDKTFHNRPFDWPRLHFNYGINVRGKLHDTLLRHHAAFPGLDHDLQRVATQFFAINPWKSNFRHGQGSMEEETFYNAKDSLATVRLDPVLDQHIDATNSRACYDVDNALVPIAARMTWVGVPIDRAKNTELTERFMIVMARARQAIETKIQDPALRTKWIDHLAFQMARKIRKGDPPLFLDRHSVRVSELTHGKIGKSGRMLKGKGPVQFQITNPDHKVAYLQAIGCKIAKQTKTGKYSGDAEVMEAFTYIEDVRTLIEFGDASYLHSHFLRLDESGVGDDSGLILDKYDRFHPTWDLHKITGRWGSSPNVQNWPKEDQVEARNPGQGRPNMRAQVVAPPGRLLVGADLSQLEARIIGLRTGDELLLSIFNGALTCDECAKLAYGKFCPKHDIHTYFACEVFPGFLDKPKELKKVLRDLVKRGEYGGFYKGNVETLYKGMVKDFPDLTLRETARIVSIIGSRMPGVDRRYQRDMREAIQKKEIRSAILGRRRCFPMGLADPTVVANYPVQTTGADIVNLGFLRICAELTRRGYYDVESRRICRAEPILQVHDALVFEVDEELAPEVAEIVRENLSGDYTYEGRTMSFPAETRYGKAWNNV